MSCTLADTALNILAVMSYLSIIGAMGAIGYMTWKGL